LGFALSLTFNSAMSESPSITIPAFSFNVYPSERVPHSSPIESGVSSNGLPVDVVVEVGSESRWHSIANLEDETIGDKFGEITRIKQGLAVEYGPFAEHQCRFEFVGNDGEYSERCNSAGDFHDCLEDYRDQNGQHLRFVAKYGNGSRPNQSETAQQLTKRLLEEKLSENVEKRECLPLPAVLSVLFEHHNMLSRLCLQNRYLGKKLNTHQHLLKTIRDRGSKLLALMVLAEADPLGETYLDFLNNRWDDDSMPLYLHQRPHFCDQNTWGNLIRHEQPLIVAELTALKEDPRLHDFKNTQPLHCKTMAGVREGGCAEVFEVLLLDDHRELYRQVWVRCSMRD